MHYCSACGNTISGNLNYCNNCGNRNERNPLIVGNSSSRIMVLGAAFVGIVGLIGFVEVLKILLNSRLDQSAVIMILLAYLLAVFLMFAVLVGHVWKNSGDIRIKAKGGREDAFPNSFRGVNTAQLDEPRDFPASVTENTTRTLDHVPFGKP